MPDIQDLKRFLEDRKKELDILKSIKMADDEKIQIRMGVYSEIERFMFTKKESVPGGCG